MIGEPPEQVKVICVHRQREQFDLALEQSADHRRPGKMGLMVSEEDRSLAHQSPGALAQPLIPFDRRSVLVIPHNMFAVMALAIPQFAASHPRAIGVAVAVIPIVPGLGHQP